ncbi:CYTH and CHAD domain-containing protein [Spirillospora sp. NPDC047279]|uniref:CYTH and CHAD domain-containing protein n=1 Tax=Spirillospora sp. NPDC047279 TaxID=3155478 RepID=UPI0033C6C42C
MAVKHLEIERKYDAEADFTVPELMGLPGVSSISGPRTHQLAATYFDTDDLRLARRGITLRRRRGGEDAGWHLKIPAGPDSKNELRAPLGRTQVVPARLASLIAAHTRGAPVKPVAQLDTVRSVVLLLDAAGQVLAEVADDAVSGRPEGGAELAWREIEVELAGGGGDLLEAAGERIVKAGARKGASSSKVLRVLGVAPERRPEPDGKTAGAAVTGYLADQVDAVLRFDPKARLAEHDAVHQMRVATRRLRSALQSYRAVIDREHTDPLRVELKWLADALGEVRDLEVLRMRFTDRLEEIGETGEHTWLDALRTQEAAAYRRLNVTLKEPRYFALLDALDALVAAPPLTERAGRKAAKELPLLVTKQWKRLDRAYKEIGKADDPDIARHETRKSAKRARYAADLAVPVLGKPAKQVSRNAKKVQEVLGGYQDGVIADEHLKAAAEKADDTHEAFVLGVLYGLEQCEAKSTLATLEETWKGLSKPSF